MYLRIMFLLLLFTIGSITVYAEEFSIMDFTDPYKYEWYDEASRLAFRDRLERHSLLLSEYGEIKQSPLTNALKTAIAPGWGHYSVNSYTKGHVFLTTQIVLLGATYYFHDRSMIHYNRYKKATQIDEMNEHYENALIPYRQSNMLLGLFAAVWVYTIYDAVLETHRYNREAWDDLTERNQSSAFIVTPTGITLRF